LPSKEFTNRTTKNTPRSISIIALKSVNIIIYLSFSILIITDYPIEINRQNNQNCGGPFVHSARPVPGRKTRAAALHHIKAVKCGAQKGEVTKM
jgi:hypothetical protein